MKVTMDIRPSSVIACPLHDSLRLLIIWSRSQYQAMLGSREIMAMSEGTCRKMSPRRCRSRCAGHLLRGFSRKVFDERVATQLNSGDEILTIEDWRYIGREDKCSRCPIAQDIWPEMLPEPFTALNLVCG